MSSHLPRSQRVPQVFAADARPGVDAFVYCKGCGDALVDQPRHQERRGGVTTMMCAACQTQHGHVLIPEPGAPTFCFRCGRPDVIVVEKGFSPTIHHLCPRCVPDRYARYRAGNFRTLQKDQGARWVGTPQSQQEQPTVNSHGGASH